MLSDEQKILLMVQEKINRMIVFGDLYHLPEVENLITRFCQLNNIDKKDLKTLCNLQKKHGSFCICHHSNNGGIIYSK